MAKKAFLVSFSLRTRVIVDVEDEDDVQIGNLRKLSL